MRTLTAAMTAHLAARSHRRCRMVRLDLREGLAIGLTDHDEDVFDFDLGDGPLTYRASPGMICSDLELATGLDAANIEISGPLTEDMTEERVLGGRYDGARVRLFEVRWDLPTAGKIALLDGEVTDVRPEGLRYTLEAQDQRCRYGQTIGGIITNQCKADFGDPSTGCHGTPAEIVAMVTAVASELAFSVSYTGSYADDFFNVGTVEALTGALAGTRPTEIHQWDQTAVGTASLMLFAPLVETPAIGDTFTIRQGCPRTRTGCMERGQILNMRAYPEVPGSDQTLRMPIPGQGNG